MSSQTPPDPWASPLDGVARRRAGQSAWAMSVSKLRGAPGAGLLGGLNEGFAAKQWAKGALGEHLVGKNLGRLPFGWLILHDLTIPGSVANVDHLAVGPAGVFTINTKNHAGRKVWVGGRTVLVNGKKVDHLPKMRWEVKEVRKVLGLTPDAPIVKGVVAIFAKEVTFKQEPSDIKVIEAGRLQRWLTGLTRILDQPAVDDLQRAAGRWAGDE